MSMPYAFNEVMKSGFAHKIIPWSNCGITYTQAIRVKGNQRRNRIRSQNTQNNPCVQNFGIKINPTQIQGERHQEHHNARWLFCMFFRMSYQNCRTPSFLELE